jgi:CARDB
MKRSKIAAVFAANGIAASAALQIAFGVAHAVPKAGATTQPVSSQAAASTQMAASQRPDLITQGLNDTKVPMLAVKNIGNAKAAASLLQVECYVNDSSPNIPCRPDTHYVNLVSPAVPMSPGIMMTSPNTWRIPVIALDAGAVAKHSLGIRPTPLMRAGLRLRLCADIAETVAESNESNNCTTFVYQTP